MDRNLDQVADGATYKRISAAEKEKLNSYPDISTIGNMSKSIYDIGNDGIVNLSSEQALIVDNNTGGLLVEGTLVTVTEYDVTTKRGEIIVADPLSAFGVHSNVALTEDIADGASGIGLIHGFINTDTSSWALRDVLYLNAAGTFSNLPPPSGIVQSVGMVAKVGGVGVGVAFFNPSPRADLWNFLEDWQAFKTYEQGAIIFYTDSSISTIFRATSDHMAGANFIIDFITNGLWETMAGDMLTAFFDPTDKQVDVYDMDNMDDGSSLVAMTTAERTKLAGLEPPTFKGVFADPTALRAAFNTAADGDTADVISTATTWAWDSALPDNPPTTGGDWYDTLLAFGGNMQSSVFDPLGKATNVFAMENMDEESGGVGTEAKIFLQSERSKLTGVEGNAQVNPTAPETKTAYEANADTNAFTDSEQTKLTGIETGATVDQTDAEIKTGYENNSNTNEFDDSEKAKLSGIASGADMLKSIYDTSDNGAVDLAEEIIIFALNDTGSTVLAGSVVYISSVDGTGKRFNLSSNDDLATVPIGGVLANDTINGAEGIIVAKGIVSIPTLGVGLVQLYLGTGGNLITVRPDGSTTVSPVLVGDIVGTFGGEDFIDVINIIGLPAEAISYDPAVSGLTSENVKNALDELAASILAAGTLSFNDVLAGTTILAGEITNPTTLSAYSPNTSSPGGGRLAVDANANVNVQVHISASQPGNNDNSDFELAVNGVGQGIFCSLARGNTLVEATMSMSYSLQLSAGDYVSVFLTGSTIDLYAMQITVGGQMS